MPAVINTSSNIFTNGCLKSACTLEHVEGNDNQRRPITLHDFRIKKRNVQTQLNLKIDI